MSNRFRFRICYTDQQGGKYILYNDQDERYLIGLGGKLYENYGLDWKDSHWEVPFDCAEQPIIQQGTGVLDKNGKEIYEGDIVDFCRFIENGVEKWETGEVHFYRGAFWLCAEKDVDKDGRGKPQIGFFASPRFLEIKGNIFEKLQSTN